MFHVRGIFRTFFREEAPIFVTFQVQFFSTDLILNYLSTKNVIRGVQGHAPRNIFENMHTAMVILVLFERFFRKVMNFWERFFGKVCYIFSP